VFNLDYDTEPTYARDPLPYPTPEADLAKQQRQNWRVITTPRYTLAMERLEECIEQAFKDLMAERTRQKEMSGPYGVDLTRITFLISPMENAHVQLWGYYHSRLRPAAIEPEEQPAGV
jgi:hypothetical protein